MRRVRDRMREPAQSEAEWQERRELLPEGAQFYAGDEHSRHIFATFREVLYSDGRKLTPTIVDEWGRSWLDAATMRPVDVPTPVTLWLMAELVASGGRFTSMRMRPGPGLFVGRDPGEFRAVAWAGLCGLQDAKQQPGGRDGKVRRA
jgi:hypothetical protein